MQDEMELVVQDTRPLDADIAHLLQADIFKIAELLKTAEVRSDQTTRIDTLERPEDGQYAEYLLLLFQDLCLPLFKLICLTLVLVQLQTSKED